MEYILFQKPLFVLLKIDEVEDHAELLRQWKKEHLSDWYLEVWQKLNRAKKPNALKRTIGYVRSFVKWLWPTILLSVVAYLNVLSAMFLAIALVPGQIALMVWFLMRAYGIICVSAAYVLERDLPNKALEASEEARPNPPDLA